MSIFKRDKEHGDTKQATEPVAESAVKEEEIATENAEEAEAESSEETLEDEALTEAKKQAEEAEVKAKEYMGMAQRVQAEFENYRKRNNEAVKNAKIDGENGVIISVIPLLDTVERAISMVTDEKTIEGLNLIVKQFNTLLGKYGVEEIKALGEVFNPDYHNAVMQVEDQENSGKIVEVLQKGYVRDGKVIRYAMVKVAA